MAVSTMTTTSTIASGGKRKRPPQPRGWPIVGHAHLLKRDSLGFLEGLARDYGDVVEFKLFRDRVILFNHPQAIEQLLVTERDKLIKDSLTRELSLLLGNGLLVSEGDFWRKQRRLAQPAFHRQRIEAYGDVMVRYTERAVETWRDGERRDINNDLMLLTLDIVAETLFGVQLAEVARKINRSLSVLMTRFAGIGLITPIGLPLPSNYKAKRAIADLDEIIYGIIRERRKSGDTGDLLSMLLAATEDDGGSEHVRGSGGGGKGGAMNDKQLRDESITLLLAGHETTALALTFALHLLGKHPEAATNLLREIDDVLGDRAATAADLPKLRYADAVIRESMRLYPPAWAVGREATAPFTIAGYDIEPGTQLWAAQWVVHRDERWFPEPLLFKPERWANDFAKTLPKHAYFPFGGGPRVCIGNAFAMMEAVLVLVTIVRRFSMRSAEPARDEKKPLELVPSITIRPKNGLPMIVTRRRRS